MTAFAIDNFRLTAAMGYAERGWHVIPVHYPKILPSGEAKCSCREGVKCKSVGKHPIPVQWTELASTDPDVLRGWWSDHPGANVGIATGARSGIVILDVDPGNGGDASLADLIALYGELPATPTVETGSGGQHYVFRHPGFRVSNSTGLLPAGLDIRGDGGQVVAAPSLHRSGDRYAWRSSPDEVALAPMPDWMLALIRPEPAYKPGDNPLHRIPSNRPDPVKRVMAYLTKCPDAISGNRGHDATLRAACECFRFGLSMSDARGVMEWFNASKTAGEQWSEKEIEHKLASALKKVEGSGEFGIRLKDDRKPEPQRPKPKPAQHVERPADELGTYLDGVSSGRIVNVSWPWPMLTRLTQALIPGTVTTVVGDPGVGKTFFVLQCLLHWRANGFDPAVFFIEKNRRYHMMRLLAQLETRGCFVDHDWIRNNGAEVRDALERNRELIDEVGESVASSDGKLWTVPDLSEWVVEQASSGRRIIVIDPITAADPGPRPWDASRDFMVAAQDVVTRFGASLVLISHPRKGNRPGAATGHDLDGGASWFRLCDTLLWLARPKKPKRVQVMTQHRLPMHISPHVFFQLLKTRDGRGSGSELAYLFGEELKFAEQGIVTADAPDPNDAIGASTNSKAPRVESVQDPFAGE